jgi:hypothetical protein
MDTTWLDEILATKYPTYRPTDPLTNQQNNNTMEPSNWETSSSLKSQKNPPHLTEADG